MSVHQCCLGQCWPDAMSLLLATIVFNCVFVICHTAPQQHVWTEDVVSYSGFQLWSVTPRNKEESEFLSNIRQNYVLDVWRESRSDNTTMDLLVHPDFQAELKLRMADAAIPYVVTISDVQTAIYNSNSNITTGNEKSKAQGHNMDWTSYHRLRDINNYLTYVADTYPQIVKLITIGHSNEGRSLNVLRITSSSTPDIKPAIWIDGGFHAREWISPAVATYIIQQLVEVSGNAGLLTNVVWYIMPMVNPDGYEYTHVKDRLWRKTRSGKGPFCRGVDPNRNFAFKWGGSGSSRSPCSKIFRGNTAFSEPETDAIANFIQGKSTQIKIYLTLHSYGQYFLVPWGYKIAYPMDYDEMLALAQNAASTFVRYKYTVGNSAKLLYSAAGTSSDWAKSIGIKYSYTIELSDTGAYGFLLPPFLIKPVCEDFFPALKVFADKVVTLKH